MNEVIKHFYRKIEPSKANVLDNKFPEELQLFLTNYDVSNPVNDTLKLKVRSNKCFEKGINVFGFNSFETSYRLFKEPIIMDDLFLEQNSLLEINTNGTIYLGLNEYNYGKVFYFDYGVIYHEISDSFNSFVDKLYYD